jgi:hypothetical protein
MKLTRLLGFLLLIAAIALAVIGGAMYFQSPKGALARLIGLLVMSVGAGAFGVLALAFLLGRSPKSRLKSVHRDTPFNTLRFHVGMLVGVVFGVLSIWYAVGAVYTGEFPAGRRGSAAPTRLSESPGWFTVKFILFSGMGVGLLWLCLPPVLRMFLPSDRE